MEKDKELSRKIMEALKPVIPEGTGFIMVFGTEHDNYIEITSNLPDDIAVEFLEGAIASIGIDPAESLEEDADRSDLN